MSDEVDMTAAASNIITYNSGGSLTDTSTPPNVYTIVMDEGQTSTGTVYENGQPLPGGEGTIEATLVGNVLWGEDAAGTWSTWVPPNWITQSGPPPLAPSVV